MNKTIEVIDLLNKIANGEEVPKKIKIKDSFYVWGERNKIKGYLAQDSDNDYAEWIDDRISVDCKEDLTTMVEIIEEEPEIDIPKIKTLPEFRSISDYDNNSIGANRLAINELIKAVKQLDNKINNK
jgi:hypothetical protein